ncbi:MAG: site-2 protease family protein [Patescibacteria group bacterium]|nr:site-2 protease family protein [Patescibacteria group bacterium]
MFLFSFLSEPIVFLAWLVAMAISVTLHEFAHALSAYLQGDATAKYSGRLSLNPLKHLDLWGTLMLLLVGFGWGKPVPYNPYNLRNQKWGPSIVALAGPGANLFLILFFGLILKILVVGGVLDVGNMLYILIEMIIILNAVWFTFNLIPIPPLDGSKLLFAILPRRFDHWKIFLAVRGPLILIFLIILDRLLNFSLLESLFNLVIRVVAGMFGLSLL